MNTREIGNLNEQRAVDFLCSKGFEIIKRNYYTRLGEIDIIAIKDRVLHFVEVKSGRGFEPIYNVTPKKIAHLCKTAQIFLQSYRGNEYYCFDVIIIQDDQLEWIENVAF